MSLTSAMSCHDIADTARNSEELILTDISSFKPDLPKQPKLTSYPKSCMGGVGDNSRARCFQFAWFQQYPWLEYSQTKDAAFCFACRHFAPSGSRKESVFTTTDFRRWKKAQDSDSGFKKHVEAPLVAKLAPPVAPPNENVWLRPCSETIGGGHVRRFVCG